MARYIDADALNIDIDLSKGITVYDIVISVVKAVKEAPTADVVERSECEKWYHEYHVIKDALKKEKEYHRSTEKLANKYQVELDAMRSAANSYKMHYEKAKQESDRLAVELEAEKVRRLADVEYLRGEVRKWKNEKYDFFQGLELCGVAKDRITRSLFNELEELMKRHIFPVVREEVIEIEREPFLVIDPQDWEALKNKYIYGRPWAAPIPTIPTGDDKGGNFA